LSILRETCDILLASADASISISPRALTKPPLNRPLPRSAARPLLNVGPFTMRFCLRLDLRQ